MGGGTSQAGGPALFPALPDDARQRGGGWRCNMASFPCRYLWALAGGPVLLGLCEQAGRGQAG